MKRRISALFTDPVYRAMYALALPIIVQNLFSAMVNSADVVMLNYVGQSSLAAVSLAVQYSNIIYMIFYGLGTGASILCAQYWGKQDTAAIQKILGIALRFSLGTGLGLFLLACLIPEPMMRIFTNDEELIRIGIGYLRIVSFSFLFWSMSEIYLAVLRSMERVRISTALSVSALLMNIFLNAVFIFGLFGAPKMGAAGVALATSISRGIQLVCCLAVSSVSPDVRLKITGIFEKAGVLMQDFLKLAIPATLNDVSWSTAFSMYLVIMGHLSTDLVAANSIISVVRNFGTVLCFAVASAAGIYVGKTIGSGNMEKAREDGRKSMVITLLAAAAGSLLIAAASPLILRGVSISEAAKGYLRIMLMIHIYYVYGIAVNTTLICGLYRAGGDSRFGLICDTIDMWCYAVPLGFITAFVLKLPPMVVYFLLCTDEFVKWPWVLRHYRSGKWIRNITREEV